ncbi:hypothetical protein [Novilysobacter spongiicola]|uniref:Uncharacterized protein n=1 Tax=Lysobacter spongiicola DSM 21749 TaxID=1122188 RepID=A0A1T4R178_9GAMM|nr:hypothetical protein [Lysobacter spongiicola]SKA09606.1 hypothetical protein SAMN02745674_01920 [Lysobacter spongiicola DSM 21749]
MTPDREDMTSGQFDRMARASHARSVEHLSPAVLARLRRARSAATEPRRGRGFGWLVAGSAAALALALVATLQLQPAIDPEPALSQPQMASMPAEASAREIADEEVAAMLATLDENPDFYLWLAANDEALPPAEFSR